MWASPILHWRLSLMLDAAARRVPWHGTLRHARQSRGRAV